MKNTSFKDIQLSPHFSLSEFLNLGKYPDNIPSMQAMVNMTYGCLTLLEPARQLVGPIIINSGYRSEEVNSRVGGVKNSQLLTAGTWLHISWTPFAQPCHYVRIGYYR